MGNLSSIWYMGTLSVICPLFVRIDVGFELDRCQRVLQIA
jgi:hypothetical protein